MISRSTIKSQRSGWMGEQSTEVQRSHSSAIQEEFSKYIFERWEALLVMDSLYPHASKAAQKTGEAWFTPCQAVLEKMVSLWQWRRESFFPVNNHAGAYLHLLVRVKPQILLCRAGSLKRIWDPGIQPRLSLPQTKCKQLVQERILFPKSVFRKKAAQYVHKDREKRRGENLVVGEEWRETCFHRAE